MTRVSAFGAQPGRAEPIVAQPSVPSAAAQTTGTASTIPTTPANTDSAAASGTPAPSAEPKGNVAININPAVANQWESDENKVLSLTPATPDLPDGVHPRMVNSRLFEIEYDVSATGPSGIGRVELWSTRDGGQSWNRHAVDNDRRSPLLVTVDEDGIYGFRVVAANGAGVGAKPPVSGDQPDIWVGVDLVKPIATILSAQQGVGPEAGQLIVTWKASDKMLADHPVSLLYSATRGGPWSTVANGLENSGRHAWPIDNQTPPQIFLRLEVRDAAGNIGAAEMSAPIIIDQSSPSIRIRDVRSHSQTGQLPTIRPPVISSR
jgi:hypothetical protein